jgi:hypothetical protein
MDDCADDDRRKSTDKLVIDQLALRGDDCTRQRRVDHWAYFATEDGVLAFREWAEEEAFRVQSVHCTGSRPLPWCIQLHHSCRPRSREISAVTIALSRKARELGGEYDGWETTVECGEEEEPVTSVH